MSKPIAFKNPAGWAKPEGARTWHYFAAGQIVAMCARVMHSTGRRYEGDSQRGPENCDICLRIKAERERKEGAA